MPVIPDAPMRTSLLRSCARSIVLAAERFLLRGLLLLTFLPLWIACRGFGVGRSRSLWAGTPIIILATCSKAERLLGIEADSLVYYTYFLTRAFEYDLSRWNRGPRVWRNVVFPWFVFSWACLRYRRFHYFCDRGLLPPGRFAVDAWELRLLRVLGKHVFLYAYGADIRTQAATRALGEFNCCTECPLPGVACVCDDALGARNQKMLSSAATTIFSMGDMIHYTPGSRNDLFYWPLDLEAEGGSKYVPRYPDPTSSAPLRIVHAPNHRGFKGTHYVIEAVDKLRSEGLPIELVLVEKVPNREAIEIYRTADVVFDQCLVGFHGYFALEAMALGKPVMVYIRDPKNYLIAPDECPFINIEPRTVESKLRELVAQRDVLHDVGRRGRTYVETYFSLGAFAKRLERAYRDVESAPARPQFGK